MKELYEKGELGRLQYMTCAHYQDMEGWPEYWKGFPPLMHPTHAVAPCLMLAGHLPDRVYARGSGKIRKELEEQYGHPFFFEIRTCKGFDIRLKYEYDLILAENEKGGIFLCISNATWKCLSWRSTSNIPYF